jgi:hypothetical protein
MLHKKTIIVGILVCGSVFLLAGCYKDKTLLVTTPPDEITTPVSFSKDLVPIFNSSCNMNGCHSRGGQVPDLTPNNAYRSLFEQDLIDVNDPANSEVMGWLTGTIKPAMPLGAAPNPSNINALMLAWIKQGAKDN